MPSQFDALAYTAVQSEDPAYIAQLRADALNLYRPTNPEELALLDRLILAQVTMRRCAKLEAGFFDLFAEACEDPDLQRPSRNLALGFIKVTTETKAFQTLLRMQQQARSEHARVHKELIRLIRQRMETDQEQMMMQAAMQQMALRPTPLPPLPAMPPIPAANPSAHAKPVTRPPTN